MEQKEIRIGSIGAGSVLGRFAKGLKEARQDGVKVKLTAVADLKSPDDIDPIIKANYDYHELPRQWAENPNPNGIPLQMKKFLEKVNAVYIASPNNTHKGYVLCALESHKDVLCTKPLTESLSTSQCLEGKLKEKGVSSGEGESGQPKFMYEDHYLYQGICMWLFAELVLGKNPFDKSKLGKVQSVRGFFVEKREASRIETSRADWLFNPEISGGGVWIDTGIHLVSILHKLGARFEITSARPRIDPGFEAELKMTVHAKLNPDDNVEGHPIAWDQTPICLIVEKEAGQTRKEINFYFEKGLVSLDFYRGTIYQLIKSHDWKSLYEDPIDPYRNVAEVFSELITNPNDRRLVSVSDVVKDMGVIKDVYCNAGLKDGEEKWRRQ